MTTDQKPVLVTVRCAQCGRETQVRVEHAGKPVICGLCNEAQQG